MLMQGQVAVVTGGAQGIGLAVARQLAEQGVKVASWDFDPANGPAMEPLEGLPVECDITDLASVQAAYEATCAKVGTPAILVNSAGIAGPNATVEDYDPAQWQKVIDVNLFGSFLCSSLAAWLTSHTAAVSTPHAHLSWSTPRCITRTAAW